MRSESSIKNESSESDIISRLIDMNMDDVVENILLNLNEADVANAVTANPKWAVVVTSRRRAEQYFPNGDFATLKTLYRRRELLSENGDARTLFQQACADSAKLRNARRKRDRYTDEFKVVSPIDCSNNCRATDNVFIGTDYIVPCHEVKIVRKRKRHRERICTGYLIQLYDRWTLQLANAITIGPEYMHPRLDYKYPRLDFVSDSAVVLCRSSRGVSVIVWNLRTGQLKAFKFSSQLVVTMHCFCELVVLLEDVEQQMIASAYKCGIGGALELIVDHESLDMYFQHNRSAIVVRSGDGLDVFGIVGCSERSVTKLANVIQLRCKHDFSLRSVVIDERSASSGAVALSHCESLFLSDCCLLFANFSWDLGRVDVLALVDGCVRNVYAFKASIIDFAPGDMSLIGNFLVLYNAWTSFAYVEHSAIVWKLPTHFTETCLRHLREGTVGETLHCDQLVRKHDSKTTGPNRAQYAKVDNYGVVSVVVDDEPQQGHMHVAMLNSMLSDG